MPQDKMPTQNCFESIFNNHLEFLRSHRGTVTHTPSGISVESTRPEFSYLILGSNSNHDRASIRAATTAHLTPWSAVTRDELIDMGFARKSGLTYMTLPPDQISWPSNTALMIKRAQTVDEMEVFSEVQGRGFLQTQEAYDSWKPWLRAANFQNINNPTQNFYVGYVAEQAVGVVLTVRTEMVTGIYAVATLPEYRKQGISTALMRHAATEAKANGSKMLTLQVMQGSYAEAFYEKLGFHTEFVVEIYGR